MFEFYFDHIILTVVWMNLLHWSPLLESWPKCNIGSCTESQNCLWQITSLVKRTANLRQWFVTLKGLKVEHTAKGINGRFGALYSRQVTCRWGYALTEKRLDEQWVDLLKKTSEFDAIFIALLINILINWNVIQHRWWKEIKYDKDHKHILILFSKSHSTKTQIYGGIQVNAQ